MQLIKPDTITFTARISEQELRDRITQEVLEQIGAIDQDGKPLQGVTAKVTRGDGRKGGYCITVSGPAPARISLPKQRPDVATET